ncbi:hypothetical protein [Mesorhizobium ciceri]|uniref:hypothetical protein n=1 Tax=Mesorhizobium TaxID=68287 RepID=UPI0012DF328C|nr:hypothetical protein [Mesorhizobium ciceri]
MPDETLNKPKPRRGSLSTPLAQVQMFSIRAIIFASAFSALAATALGAELQRSCLEPPATVIELTGINTQHARAKAKFSEPDIIKACHEGYVDQGGFSSPEKCIRETKVTLLGDEISAVANCSKGTLRLGEMTFKMPVDENCASGGIFAAPAFTMLCPKYRGKVVNP